MVHPSSVLLGACTGIGPVKAVKMLREHRSIEKVVQVIQKEGKVHATFHGKFDSWFSVFCSLVIAFVFVFFFLLIVEVLSDTGRLAVRGDKSYLFMSVWETLLHFYRKHADCLAAQK